MRRTDIQSPQKGPIVIHQEELSKKSDNQQQPKPAVETDLNQTPTQEENDRWVQYTHVMGEDNALKYTDAISNRYSERYSRQAAGFRFKKTA